MGGGESDARYFTMAPTELDGFAKCAVPHCDWHVRLPERRCYTHGGPSSDQYRSEPWGGKFDVRMSADHPEGTHA